MVWSLSSCSSCQAAMNNGFVLDPNPWYDQRSTETADLIWTKHNQVNPWKWTELVIYNNITISAYEYVYTKILLPFYHRTHRRLLGLWQDTGHEVGVWVQVDRHISYSKCSWILCECNSHTSFSSSSSSSSLCRVTIAALDSTGGEIRSLSNPAGALTSVEAWSGNPTGRGSGSRWTSHVSNSAWGTFGERRETFQTHSFPLPLLCDNADAIPKSRN